jgi:hypothetical protein
MKRQNLQLSFVVLGVVLLAALSVISPLSAGDANAQSECSLSTVKGTYIFHAQGVFIDGHSAPPYAEAGVWTLDGKGNAQGVFSATVGTEFIDKESFTATYTHQSGCIFVALAPVGKNKFVKFDLYTSPSGETMTYFGPGFSGIQIKQ